jgi:NADPH-dependent curcumin reductase CurA
MHHVFAKSLKLSGYIFWDLETQWGQVFKDTIPALVASGEIKYKEDVVRGLDKVGDAFLAVQKGTNKGKAVVLLSED